MWIVEGGKYKASFLVERAEGERCLISEVSSIFSDFDILMWRAKGRGR